MVVSILAPICGGKMGNFSSCTTSLNSQQKRSSPPLLAHTANVARVLLIDGSMLKFRVPIKVIKLLLDYPHHVLCPLDSLKPGLHSLSSMLPDEKLQLGRLYLLLPFKTTANLQESCMKSQSANLTSKQSPMSQKRDPINKTFLQRAMKEREERKQLLRRDESEMGFARRGELYKNGDVGQYYCDKKKLQKSGSLQYEEQSGIRKKSERGKGSKKQRNHEDMVESEVGFASGGGLYRNGDVGHNGNSGSAAAGGYGRLSSGSKRRGMMDRDGYIGTAVHDRISCAGPLCDTPELQRAYRSFLLLRSSSWTPRLQPILERR